ncbi:hypothetical protein HJC23_005385 [Cyclotella cryptica]|uniref:Phospholipid/glycerol acyltransferase domain-containing protein n=1 Tax=Cyclotella cryptica TaxID=29204 RepID=A0ABD3P2Y9_9STRA
MLSSWFGIMQLLVFTTPVHGFMPPCVSTSSIGATTARVAGFSSVRAKLRSTATPTQFSPVDHLKVDSSRKLGKVQSLIVKSLMISYILSMCVALPVTLFPVYLLHKARVITKPQKEKMSLQVGQFCSRWMMRLFPFARKRVIVDKDDQNYRSTQPSIWACNHISLLDIFFVLALDQKMRGKKRRPIKILYWKGLESNPITCLLFKMCGFIPVDMAANEHGAANEYDPKSFKQMLKSTKEAIKEGFDIGLLPEGQPNPTPEKGLQPIFTGAFTLAKMSRRPIQMMALYGLHNMWHPDTNIGMCCTSRDMAVRVYPSGRLYDEADEFAATFEAVVGYFGAHGKDMPSDELKMWLDGTMWKTELSRRAATRMELECVDPSVKDESASKQNEETEELSEI